METDHQPGGYLALLLQFLLELVLLRVVLGRRNLGLLHERRVRLVAGRQRLRKLVQGRLARLQPVPRVKPLLTAPQCPGI